MDNVKTSAVHYNDKVVRQLSIMAVIWGVIGMLVGVFIAAQLAWPELNFGIPWLSFGRLRPLHTNAVIFAFGGSALDGNELLRGAAYLPNHACLPRSWLPSPSGAGKPVIVAAVITLPLGFTSGKEYAELEWPIDILITAGVGVVRHCVLWHHWHTQGQAHLCGQLVLRCLHHCRWPCCTWSIALPFLPA